MKGLVKLFSKPLILAVVCVLMAGLIAGGISFFLMGKASSENSEANHKEPIHLVEKLMFPLGDFTINLVDADRYLRTSVQLEVEVSADPEAKRDEESSGHGGGHGSNSGGASV